MNSEPAMFFLKKGDGAVYGPVDSGSLVDWARQGRVAPDDSISKDRLVWNPAPTLADLEMNWLVELNDGSQYGPVNLLALRELTADGSVSEDATVTHRITERSLPLTEALQELTAAPAVPEEEVQRPIDVETSPIPIVEEPKAVQETSIGPQPTVEIEVPNDLLESKRENWRELAIQNDSSQKEATKWKTMYEADRARNHKKEQTLSERVEELRKSEMTVRMRLDLAERKLRAAEDNMQLFRQTVEADPANPQSAQLIPLIESYNELSQRYDHLMQQLVGKSSEVQNLLESRKLTEELAEEQVNSMREIARRDREEADEARRRLAEIEQEHLQLVKAYRDLNDRFVRMRQQSHGEIAQPEPGQSALPLKRQKH